MAEESRSMWSKVKREFFKILPIWGFFFVAFMLFSLDRMILSIKYGVPYVGLSRAFVAAIVISKVFLAVDHFRPFIPNRTSPLIYYALGSSIIYLAAALFLDTAEDLLLALWHHHSLIDTFRETLLRLSRPQAIALELSIFILIFSFVAVRELIREIGEPRVKELFFGRSPKS